MRLHFEDGERAMMAARLGLAEDADDAAVAAAVATWLNEEPEEETEDDDTDVEEIDASGQDVVVVDTLEFNRLRRRDRQAGQIEAAAAIRDRNELIEEAIADGKFSPARRSHYRDRYDSDPTGTRALIGRLHPNTVPLETIGQDEPTDEVDQSSYPTEWLPEVAAKQASQQQGGRPQSRVHGEEV